MAQQEGARYEINKKKDEEVRPGRFGGLKAWLNKKARDMKNEKNGEESQSSPNTKYKKPNKAVFLRAGAPSRDAFEVRKKNRARLLQKMRRQEETTRRLRSEEKKSPGLGACAGVAAGVGRRADAKRKKPKTRCFRAQVHALGSLPASGDELMLLATGKPLRPAAFVAYLQAKFAPLYGL